jgi:hypothetical protein
VSLILLDDPAALDEPKSRERDNDGRVPRPCSERLEDPTWRAGKIAGTEQMKVDHVFALSNDGRVEDCDESPDELELVLSISNLSSARRLRRKERERQ